MIQIAKYFITGACAAAVDFAIFALLVKLAGWPWYIANLLSFVAATFVNYVISVRHVFTSGARFRRRDEVAMIFLVSSLGLALNQAAIFLLSRLGVAILLAKVGATAVVFFWNYGARRHFVFKEKPAVL